MDLQKFDLGNGVTPFAFDEPIEPLRQAYCLLSALGAAWHDANVVDCHRDNFTSHGLPADWPSTVNGLVPTSEFLACTSQIIEGALEGIQTLVAYGAFLASQQEGGA